MPVCLRLWLRRGLAAVALALLAACATPRLSPPDALLDDALFGHPPRPAGADTVLTLSPAMQAHLQALRARRPSAEALPLALARSLYRALGDDGRFDGPAEGALRLDYDASITRDAAQAFDARSGNCLSLVVMTAALADALGLEVDFRQVLGEDQFRRQGGLTLRSGHVNLLLLPPLRAPGSALAGAAARRGVLIDFLPQETAAALPAEPISRDRVLAMFFNNRAVESLLAGDVPQAYAWAREALRRDPGFAGAANTLGVVYQRRGALAAAAVAYERVLALDATQPGTLDNLAQVRRAQGREAEAQALERRLAALEPWPPLHFLREGEAALAAEDWTGARRLFQRELRRQPDLAEAWFGLARAQLALGDRAGAEQALQRARAASGTPAEQRRHAAKLDALRAQAAH